MKPMPFRPLTLALALSLAALAGPGHADAVKASRFYEDGLARFEAKDTAGAIIQLKNALQQDRNMLAAHLLLARAYLDTGDVGPAEVEFREALRLGVSRAEVAVPLGRIYLMQGKPQALLDAVSAEGLPPAVKLEVLSLRGTAHAALGKEADASRSFADARALDPGSSIPLVAEVPVLLALGKTDLARERAARAVQLGPDDAGAYNVRASVRHAAGDLAGALQDYEQALALSPGFIDAGVARAGILIDLGRDHEARERLDVLAAAAPAEPRIAYLRALLASRRGDAPAATAHLEEVARLVDALPSDWLAGQEQLLMAGALAHHAGRQYEKARKYLDVLVVRYPRNPGARRLLAAVYVETGDFQRAAGLLENVLRVQPDDPQTLQLLGRAYFGLKRYAKATELLERAAALGGSGPQLQASLGFSRVNQGDTVAGLKSLEQAFDKASNDAALGIALANLLMRQGEARKALAVAERLVRELPALPASHNLLGMVKAAANDLAGARHAYRDALQRDARFVPARLNLARLDVAERRFDDARAVYAELLRRNKRDATAMYESALLERAAGNAAEAVRWIEKAAAERPGDVRTGLALIEFRSAAGDTSGALDAARALAVRRKEDLSVLAALARAEIAAGDNKAAQHTLRDMTRMAEFDAGTQVRIGYLQLAAANSEGAAYCAQKALQGNPGDRAAQVLAAEAALAARDLDGASRRVAALRSQFPHDADTWRIAGDVELARRNYPAAADAYRQAQERAPSSPLVLRRIGVFVAQGKPAAGIPVLTAWLRQHDDDVAARKALAELHLRGNDLAAAKREYERLAAGAAADAEVLNNLANVLIRLGDPAAVAVAERAHALAPADANVIDTLGWALARNDRLDDALRFLRDARLRASANPEVRWHLAYVLARTGRKQEARDELEGALNLGSDFEGIDEAKRLRVSLSM